MSTSRKLQCASVALALFCLCASARADYRIPLTVRTGFYERTDAIVAAAIDFGRAADTASLKLLQMTDDGAKEIDFWFEPEGQYKGKLTWILPGKQEAMTELKCELRFKEGQWTDEPSGSKAVADAVRRRSNLIVNGSFEEDIPPDAVKEKTNWKGKREPAGWKLHDYAWADRNEADITALCRVSEEEAKDGKQSLKFVTDQREKKLIRGFAYTPEFFPLKPKTKYTFSYWLKVTERGDGGGPWKVVQAEVQYMNEKKKRIQPKNYAVNRLQLAYNTTRHPKEEYLDKWVKVSRSMVTPEEVRLGRVWVTTDIQGTAYYDDLTLVEQQEGEAVQVEAGKVVQNDE